MGKKSRGKKHKTKVRLKIDESYSFGPLRLERAGRHTRFTNNSTPEQHAEFLKRTEDAHRRIFEDLKQQVPTLQALVVQYDPLEIMHRAAYMVLPLFSKYSSENEYSYEESFHVAGVEYLQYLIARGQPAVSPKRLSEEDWENVWKKLIEVLRLTGNYLLTRKTLSSPPSAIDELRFWLDQQRLAIRGNRYPFFLEDHLKSCLLPYDQWLRHLYGISAEVFVRGAMQIEEYQKTGVLAQYGKVVDLQKSLVNCLGEKGYSIVPGANPAECLRAIAAIETDECPDLRTQLQKQMRITFTPAIFDITKISSLPPEVLKLLSVQPGQSILNLLTGPDHDDLSPLSTSVLHYRPFLEVGGRFYTFYHTGFSDRTGELIEADLFAKMAQQVPVMAKRRSNYIENETAALFRSILAPDFVHQNLFYPNPDPEGGLTELDVMIGCDDVLFLIEVKAGAFSEGASRGAPKEIEKKLSDLIIEGQRQSERAERYIRSTDEAPFYDEGGKTVVQSVRVSQFRKVFRVVVTREPLGWVGAKIAVLSILDPNLSKSFPWHISLDDLRVATHLFKDDELRFVHFLEQRLHASSTEPLEQHDELEHIALYNAINCYYDLPVEGLDTMSYDPSYMRDIDSYFSEKYAGGNPELPTQKLSPRLKSFISALPRSRQNGRFEVGSIVLSMDEKSRDDFANGLAHLQDGLLSGRQRSIRMPFSEPSYGITVSLANDQNFVEETLKSAAQMERSKCAKWLAVQLESSQEISVRKIVKIVPGMFAPEHLMDVKEEVEAQVQKKMETTKIGRNEKCPCGSGKKFKKCHGA